MILGLFASAYNNYAASLLTMSDVEVEREFDSNLGNYGTGGLSVGTTYNRLFTLTADESSHMDVLYYYRDLYSNEAPTRIYFSNYLLGHANAMAIDSNYLYIAGWQNTENGYKNRIMRISRSAINAMSDGYTVNFVSSTDRPNGLGTPVVINRVINNITYTVLEEFKPVDSNGNTYNQAITAITRYASDPDIGMVKFIVDYTATDATYYPPHSDPGIAYTIATLQNGQLVVSTDPEDIFFVPLIGHSYTYTENGESTTKTINMLISQDIFYTSNNLYIPLWDNTNANKAQSLVVKVNISALKSAHTGSLTINPTTVTVFDFSTKYQKTEIESLAFVKKEANGTTNCTKVVVNANVIRNGEGFQRGVYFVMENQGNLV